MPPSDNAGTGLVIDDPAHSGRILHRLTLNVSNRCPLACRYCYANSGRYDTGGMLMPPETALAAINYTTNRYDRVAHVNFFGGEPALNANVIEVVCKYFTYLHRIGILTHLPTFGITTSGFRLSRRIFDLIAEHNITVTVSVDGPPTIHDALRVTKRQSATFFRVAATIDELRGATGRTPEIECTYTAEHLRQGIDLINLLDFFHDRFGASVIHVPMVVTPSSSPWYVPLDQAKIIYPAGIRHSVRNLATGIESTLSLVSQMLAALAEGRAVEYYCPAATATLAINADGNVYACPMLTNGAGSRMGNVHDGCHVVAGSADLGQLITEADKWRNKECQDCWAQRLCYGCIAEDLVRGAHPSTRSATPGQSQWCDFRRLLVQTLLVSIDKYGYAPHITRE